MQSIALVLARPCFGYRECVRRCRVFGPGLFVKLTVYLARAFVRSGRSSFVGPSFVHLDSVVLLLSLD